MPAQVTNYKCPACTGPLHFVGGTGKLECDYCGTSFDVAEIEALYAKKDDEAEKVFNDAERKKAEAEEKAAEDAASGSDSGWDTQDGMRAYSCPSCGAELICDETTAATSCPYCGNPTIVPGQLSGTLKPDLVIPFKLDKAAAVAALKSHYKRKIFLPGSFTKGNHIDEVKGLYVPFWLFDSTADADCRFEATRSHTHTEGDYRVTVTEHYDVHRAATMDFARVPADGSSKMPDDYMDSIEPFDYSELKEFSTAYLPGYLADKYDVDSDKCSERIDARCRNTAVDVCRNDVSGYESVTQTHAKVELGGRRVQYALLPVWTLLTKWNGQNYLFAMNGQTGRLVGDLPVSRKKFWGLFAGIAAVLCAVFTLTGLGNSIYEMLFY